MKIRCKYDAVRILIGECYKFLLYSKSMSDSSFGDSCEMHKFIMHFPLNFF